MIVHLKNLIVHIEEAYKKQRYIIRLLINLICFVNFWNFENIGSSYSIGKKTNLTLYDFLKYSVKTQIFETFIFGREVVLLLVGESYLL